MLSWHALDLAGDRIVAVGHFEKSATIDHCVVRSKGATDIVVAAFDLEGHCLHAQASGGAGADYGYAVSSRRNSDEGRIQSATGGGTGQRGFAGLFRASTAGGGPPV